MAKPMLISPISKQGIQLLRVAAYCRVSSSSADQLNSYATQIDYYTKLAKKKKSEWNMVEIFADEGLSGMKANNRPEFQRMIRMCELHQIDLIITKSVSRFSRNTKEALEYARKLKNLGIGVIFEKEGINTQSLGDEMLLNTFAAIAQEESKAISQNQRLSIVKRMELGIYVDSNAPYGFRLEAKQLVEYPPEAGIVRWIFHSYLCGMSTSEIAKELPTVASPLRTARRNGSPPKSPICSPMSDTSEIATIRKPTVIPQFHSSNPKTVARKICTTPPKLTPLSSRRKSLIKYKSFSKREKNSSPNPQHSISILLRATFDAPNVALSIAVRFEAVESNGSVPSTKKTPRLANPTTTAKKESMTVSYQW